MLQKIHSTYIATLMLATLAGLPAFAADKPNIVVIMTDDVSPFDIFPEKRKVA